MPGAIWRVGRHDTVPVADARSTICSTRAPRTSRTSIVSGPAPAYWMLSASRNGVGPATRYDPDARADGTSRVDPGTGGLPALFHAVKTNDAVATAAMLIRLRVRLCV